MQMDVTYRGTQAELAELLRDRAAELRARPRPTRMDTAAAEAWDAAALIVDSWVNTTPADVTAAILAAAEPAKPATVDGKARTGRPVPDAPQA